MGLLEGKTAIITGAGRGIGQAAATMMAREGAAVVVNDLDQVPARETVDEIVRYGGAAQAWAGDVTASGFADELVNVAVETYGSLDIIVNNAGYTWDSMLHKMTDEQWLAMLEVHVTAPFKIVRAAAPHMREIAKREIAEGKTVMRKIVSISSSSGIHGNVGQANYAAAKAAVVGLTKTLAREWGPLNVNCNAVAFGWIDTRLTQPRERGERMLDRVPLGVPESVRMTVREKVPLGRFGTRVEAASAILFLASPLSDFVNGHILEVSGGLDM